MADGRSNARWVVVVAILVLAVLTGGCGGKKSTVVRSPRTSVLGSRVESSFASAAGYDALERKNAEVKPDVPDYTVKPGLANVVNLKLFKPVLDSQQIAMIVKNKFVVSPTDYIQMFHVYENNAYQRPEMFPSFITTDSMLHTYHVFYDYTLRQIETNKLYDAAVKLTETMLAVSQTDLANARNELVKDAARRNVGYFALARKLLTDEAPPAEVAQIVEADLQKVESHGGLEVSEIFGHMIDFSQFVPRGHYTRTEKLKKYFKGMMWYGLSSFPIPQRKIGPRPTRQALMVVRNLRTAQCDGEPVMKQWDMVYEPTVFYVGSADDYTVHHYARLSDQFYGKDPSIEAFADDAKLTQFIAAVEDLPGPGIEHYAGVFHPLYPAGRQFRFMGQRFIPDSRVLQELIRGKVPDRYFPKGLDVFAAMGSDRALDILYDSYEENKLDDYESQMAKMRKELAETDRETWQSNLYWGWLWALKSLVGPAPAGYPAFMRSDAWLDKSLFTGLGSWTELRHDTILYAKQSFTTSECGGSEEEEEIPTPKGYVEPNLEFWTKLAWLNEHTRQGLESRGLLDAELKDKFEKLGDWLEFCRRITIKELTNQKVTEEEYGQIVLYGAELEHLTLSFAGGDLLSDTDKDMAIVADVHSADLLEKGFHCLEEATGRAGAIYVVVPIEGKLYLTRGAVFTHYEFTHPAADRLTDEKWQEMLQEGKQPPFAVWIKSFFVDTEKKPPMEFTVESGGC